MLATGIEKDSSHNTRPSVHDFRTLFDQLTVNYSNNSLRVMVEFTDPNPFKEFHIGHLYSNAVGEALSRLHEAVGHDVRRAIYQGDVGMHVAKSIYGMMEKVKSPYAFAQGKQKSKVKSSSQKLKGKDNIDLMINEAQVALDELEKLPLTERVNFLGQAY